MSDVVDVVIHVISDDGYVKRPLRFLTHLLLLGFLLLLRLFSLIVRAPFKALPVSLHPLGGSADLRVGGLEYLTHVAGLEPILKDRALLASKVGPLLAAQPELSLVGVIVMDSG